MEDPVVNRKSVVQIAETAIAYEDKEKPFAFEIEVRIFTQNKNVFLALQAIIW